MGVRDVQLASGSVLKNVPDNLSDEEAVLQWQIKMQERSVAANDKYLAMMPQPAPKSITDDAVDSLTKALTGYSVSEGLDKLKQLAGGKPAFAAAQKRDEAINQARMTVQGNSDRAGATAQELRGTLALKRDYEKGGWMGKAAYAGQQALSAVGRGVGGTAAFLAAPDAIGDMLTGRQTKGTQLMAKVGNFGIRPKSDAGKVASTGLEMLTGGLAFQKPLNMIGTSVQNSARALQSPRALALETVAKNNKRNMGIAAISGAGSGVVSELAGQATRSAENPEGSGGARLAGALAGGVLGVGAWAGASSISRTNALKDFMLKGVVPEELDAVASVRQAGRDAGVPLTIGQAMTRPTNLQGIEQQLYNSTQGVNIRQTLRDQDSNIAGMVDKVEAQLPNADMGDVAAASALGKSASDVGENLHKLAGETYTKSLAAQEQRMVDVQQSADNVVLRQANDDLTAAENSLQEALAGGASGRALIQQHYDEVVLRSAAYMAERQRAKGIYNSTDPADQATVERVNLTTNPFWAEDATILMSPQAVQTDIPSNSARSVTFTPSSGGKPMGTHVITETGTAAYAGLLSRPEIPRVLTVDNNGNPTTVLLVNTGTDWQDMQGYTLLAYNADNKVFGIFPMTLTTATDGRPYLIPNMSRSISDNLDRANPDAGYRQRGAGAMSTLYGAAEGMGVPVQDYIPNPTQKAPNRLTDGVTTRKKENAIQGIMGEGRPDDPAIRRPMMTAPPASAYTGGDTSQAESLFQARKLAQQEAAARAADTPENRLRATQVNDATLDKLADYLDRVELETASDPFIKRWLEQLGEIGIDPATGSSWADPQQLKTAITSSLNNLPSRGIGEVGGTAATASEQQFKGIIGNVIKILVEGSPQLKRAGEDYKQFIDELVTPFNRSATRTLYPANGWDKSQPLTLDALDSILTAGKRSGEPIAGVRRIYEDFSSLPPAQRAEAMQNLANGLRTWVSRELGAAKKVGGNRPDRKLADTLSSRMGSEGAQNPTAEGFDEMLRVWAMANGRNEDVYLNGVRHVRKILAAATNRPRGSGNISKAEFDSLVSNPVFARLMESNKINRTKPLFKALNNMIHGASRRWADNVLTHPDGEAILKELILNKDYSPKSLALVHMLIAGAKGEPVSQSYSYE